MSETGIRRDMPGGPLARGILAGRLARFREITNSVWEDLI